MHNLKLSSNNFFIKNSRTMITMSLLLLLTVSVYSSTSLSMVSALDVGSLGNDNGISSMGLGNICFASDCTNQIIKDNQNSPVVTDSKNTNIESGDGGINSGLGITLNPLEECFVLNGPGIGGLEAYETAIRNFENGISTNDYIIGVAITMNIPTPQNTQDLWNLFTNENLTLSDRDALLAGVSDLLSSSGFTSTEQYFIYQCIKSAVENAENNV